MLVEQAQQAMTKADYEAALRHLQEAAALVPDDERIKAALEQTHKAALRHQAAVQRNRAIAETGDHIGALLEAGNLEGARDALLDAGLRFGRHSSLTALQARLDRLEGAAERTAQEVALDRARERLAARDWNGALAAVEEVVRLDADNEEAAEIQHQARVGLEKEAGRQHRSAAIDEASEDIERLIAAGELQRASRRLREAMDNLGFAEPLTALRDRLDDERATQLARQRLEWKERRANEAASLMREAERLSLQGRYEEAVSRLHQAHELDSERPDIESRLQTATAALERQRADAAQREAIQRHAAQIKARLDALRLDEAATLLAEAGKSFGDDARFRALKQRLENLRQAESGALSAAGLAAPDLGAEDVALARQRALAAAYSYKQIFLFPFRGFGATALWTLAGLLLLLDAASAIPVLGTVAMVLRATVPLLALGLFLSIVAMTVRGRNNLPPLVELGGPGRWLLDLGLVLLAALLVALPCAIFLLTRGGHGLLGAAAGPTGWLLVAALGWLAIAGWLLSAGAAGTFGRGRAFYLPHHGRGLLAGSPDTLVVINAVFGLVVLTVWVWAVARPAVPWLGAPVASLLEAYLLLATPHAMGVLFRHHQIEMGKIYG